MKIQTKFSILTAVLISAVVISMGALLARAQRRALADDAQQRLAAVMDGVTRIAQESVSARDELMLLSYLMFLQHERPELALAAVTYRGHTARVGSAQARLLVLTRTVSPRSVPDRGLGGGASPVIMVRLGFRQDRLDADLNRALRTFIARIISVAVLFIVLGMLGAAALSRLLTRPLMTLTSAVMAVGQGRLDVSVPVAGRDEVSVLEARFNAMTARLKGLTQFREDILYTLTHELNTPLNGLKGYLELWRDRKLPRDESERREIIDTMLAAVLRMEQSLGNALRLFRGSDSGAQAAPRQVVWVEGIFNEVRNLLAPMARAKRITLHPLPPGAIAFLTAAEEPLRQIVTNLVSNALKYTPDGGEVRLGLKDAPQELQFWVSDTGYGIPAQDIPHLFTKFYRSGSAGVQCIPGSGLGLSIAQRAAESLGGRIQVKSELGKGSTFLVVIPKRPLHLEAKP